MHGRGQCLETSYPPRRFTRTLNLTVDDEARMATVGVVAGM